jgi:transposase
MWIPPENADPVLYHAPTRKSVAFFGAVCPADGRLVAQPAYPFNAEAFLTFLKLVLRHARPNRQIIIILDNARYHHSAFLKPWLALHRRDMQLDFLPPYSPDLNPIERVWKLTRHLCTHNRYFSELEQLVADVRERFIVWHRPNETLRRLCAII